MWEFGHRSLAELEAVDERLQTVCFLALNYSPFDFGILCGIRTMEEQKKKVSAGFSTTLNSRHLANEMGVSEAVDFGVYVNGALTWDVGYYRKVNQAFVRAAIELGTQIECGALWRTFVDAGHVQLLEEF